MSATVDPGGCGAARDRRLLPADPPAWLVFGSSRACGHAWSVSCDSPDTKLPWQPCANRVARDTQHAYNRTDTARATCANIAIPDRDQQHVRTTSGQALDVVRTSADG
ncbi:hypothetical protein FRACA_120044 [Frankia canadensis]|uniref:Uncharacterized protein n=1 Tax=Frankia canadensis TaxID=1836972 RepID=A0A2I2KJY4_9ACTN|nr:hypothetical protein FRACA_120044 [Frankia canadensis]SOU53271.1 hypothetical protein FRACA_120044 [Frankia canadensis]